MLRCQNNRGFASSQLSVIRPKTLKINLNVLKIFFNVHKKEIKISLRKGISSLLFACGSEECEISPSLKNTRAL